MTNEFSFHGVGVRVTTDSAEAADRIALDFSYFASETGSGSPRISLHLRHMTPPWASAPDARCVLVQPGCVVYDAAGVRWVDYQGRALCRWSYDDETGEIWSTDVDLAHEIAYLLILSRVGELHDQRGLHRVHALGVEVAGQGVLCLLPSGGGKTTLGLAALGRADTRILSDDIPIVTRSGELLCFPNRMGCVEKPALPLPPQYVRRFARREHGDKWLIDMRAFPGRIAPRAAPRVLIIGERQLRGEPRVQPCPARSVAGELVRSLVVGLGLPQVVEYFLRFDALDAVRKSPIVASRLVASGALLARARTYRFHLGHDRNENARVFHSLLDSVARGDELPGPGRDASACGARA